VRGRKYYSSDMTGEIKLRWGYEIVILPTGGTALARDGQVLTELADEVYYLKNYEDCTIIELSDSLFTYVITPNFYLHLYGYLEYITIHAPDARSKVVFVVTDPDGRVRVIDEAGNEVLFEHFPDFRLLVELEVELGRDVLIITDATRDKTLVRLDLRTLTTL